MDVAKSKGIIINKEKLEETLGVPVVFAVAHEAKAFTTWYEAVNVATYKTKAQTLKYRKAREEKLRS